MNLILISVGICLLVLIVQCIILFNIRRHPLIYYITKEMSQEELSAILTKRLASSIYPKGDKAN